MPYSFLSRLTFAAALLITTVGCSSQPPASQPLPGVGSNTGSGLLLSRILSAPGPPDRAAAPSVAPFTRTARRLQVSATP